MRVAAEDKKGFWRSKKGRAVYFVAVGAGFLSYILMLHFLVSNSLITDNANSLGGSIFWIPYLVLLHMAPTKNEKGSRVAHKIFPYLIADSAVCFALLLFAYFLVSNTIITSLDYNGAIASIILAFIGAYAIMIAFAELQEWKAKKKTLKPQ